MLHLARRSGGKLEPEATLPTTWRVAPRSTGYCTIRTGSRPLLGDAAFGAPLSALEVGEADFATYDGVLQMGVPPLRLASPTGFER